MVGPKQPTLLANQIHVWCVDLHVSDLTLLRLKSFLNAEELKRAERFHFEKDQIQFTAARGYLREILGAYTQLPPASLNFKYQEHGKPALALENRQLQFNLSHTKGFALYAIAHQYNVGIDIESQERTIAADELAARFFAPAEVEMLARTPANLKSQAFFNIWTRKEALIKALGKGLSFPLDQFVVNAAESAKLLEIRGDKKIAQAWALYSLQPAQNYIGALAVDAPAEKLEIFYWCWC